MTKEEIIEMVKQTDLLGIIDSQYYENEKWIPDVVEFAKLVAEHEREACAKICDDRTTAYQYATDVWAQEHINEARHLSQEIRARGQSNG